MLRVGSVASGVLFDVKCVLSFCCLLCYVLCCMNAVLMCFLLRVCCECDICIVHFSVWSFVFVGFSVMCEVHFCVFCVYLRAFSWCYLLCVWFCLCSVPHSVCGVYLETLVFLCLCVV